jgi:plastocyanin
MASIDKAAIVFSIAIALVGVGIAAMGSAVDNSPAAPTQQMSAEAEARAEAAAEARAEAAAEARAEAAAEARAEAAAADEAAEMAAADEAAEKAAAKAEAAAVPQTHIVETAMGSGAPGCETSNACYLPADITISTGDTVQWDNVDTAAHTVSGGSPADGPSGVFDSSLLMAGGDYSFTFDDAGNYDYFCMVHPWMVGSVTVN